MSLKKITSDDSSPEPKFIQDEESEVVIVESPEQPLAAEVSHSPNSNNGKQSNQEPSPSNVQHNSDDTIFDHEEAGDFNEKNDEAQTEQNAAEHQKVKQKIEVKKGGNFEEDDKSVKSSECGSSSELEFAKLYKVLAQGKKQQQNSEKEKKPAAKQENNGSKAYLNLFEKLKKK